MPRRIRSSTLETRTARLKLAPQGKPYWIAVAPGISLGYRRNTGPGAWNVRAADGKGSNWIKAFGIADDQEDADGANVLTFWQAADKAKALARGGDADAGRPATVAEALTDYAADLAVRGGGPTNASSPRHHLPASMLAKTVSTVSVKDLRHWRNGLTKTLKATSVNRLCKSLKAAFNLAAAHDDRIGNAKAWTVGLAAIPETDDTDSNVVLSDQQRRDVVAAAYSISPPFGLYCEVHAATGARSSQIAALDVDDLHAGKEPKLMMPSSFKGKARRTRTRKPIPITPGLAKRLKAATAGRAADQPLLPMTSDDKRWSASAHYRQFREAARAAELPDGTTIYSLRHTAITRALLAGVPVRLVASSFDTSVAMIEKTYSKFIADHGDAQMRRALFDIDAPPDGNVIPMAR
jgi:integrase